MKKTSLTKRYDALVLGGGPAGQVLACALAQSGAHVAVLDRQDPAIPLQAWQDGRALALAYGGWRFLEQIGVARHMRAQVGMINDIRVADGASAAHLDFLRQDGPGTPLGVMARMVDLRRALAHRMREASGNCDVLAPVEIHALERGAAGVTIRLNDGRTVQAPLLVGADGRDSFCRREAGIGVTDRPYHEYGVVAELEHSLDHQGIAVEHFLPGGPFATLPLPGRHCGIVWTLPKTRGEALAQADDESFQRLMQQRAGDWLGQVRVVPGSRFAYPLTLRLAHHLTAPRLALMGDAAHVVHPLAGQGFNLGLRDAQCLAGLVTEYLRLGLDPGAPDLLTSYARRRWPDIAALAVATHGLDRLFAPSAAPVMALRRMGLTMVHHLPIIKRVLIRKAMGLATA
ncbi:MAG: FAD-dependent monooxygenase [Alphaproteobacteria bacterium]|nr:MAG: FAD-dependent monooxygenase [Alphaproteobacteria bacterium]